MSSPRCWVWQRHANRAAVADHQRRQCTVLRDVDETCDHALLLLGQRLAAREAPVLARVLPGAVELGVDLGVQLLGPVARPGLGEALVEDRLEPEALADDLRGLAGPRQRRRVQRGR